MLLMLERPARSRCRGQLCAHNPLAHRARPEAVLIDKTPIDIRCAHCSRSSSSKCGAPRRSVVQQPDEEHHYLGYEQPLESI